MQTIADGAEVMKGSTNWHFGYGADLQVGYQLNSFLKVGVYSGWTGLTGSRMDGMPKHLHKNNFVWESGIRLGFNLSKKKKNKVIEVAPAPQTEIQQKEESPKENTIQPEPVSKAEAKVTTQDTVEQTKVTFPNIYFSFNSIDIRKSEEVKLNEILNTLKTNPEVKVTVTGWCDTQGDVAVNKRVSKQRAEAVKAWLVKKGIEASRIQTIGKGSDDTQNAENARRVETTDNRNQ